MDVFGLIVLHVLFGVDVEQQVRVGGEDIIEFIRGWLEPVPVLEVGHATSAFILGKQANFGVSHIGPLEMGMGEGRQEEVHGEDKEDKEKQAVAELHEFEVKLIISGRERRRVKNQRNIFELEQF